MVYFFLRHGRQSSRPLRAKFWDSLVAGTSAPGPLANVPVTRLPRFRHNLVTGTLTRCPKSVPVTSIYCISANKNYDKPCQIDRTSCDKHEDLVFMGTKSIPDSDVVRGFDIWQAQQILIISNVLNSWCIIHSTSRVVMSLITNLHYRSCTSWHLPSALDF